MPPDVFRQVFRGRVPPLRLFSHRHQDDHVEVALQLARQPFPAALDSRAGLPAMQDRSAGPFRLRLANGQLQFQRRLGLQLIRVDPGQQTVQEHAESIDVACRRDRLPQHLFRTGVLGRHGAHIGSRHRARARVLGFQQLGDAEVKQLGRAIGRDQNVAGLQIPMHHQVLMSVGHGPADNPEQLQPLGGGKLARVAILVDGLPFDIVHDQVRRAILGGSAVEQLDDIGVIERRQRLALVVEPAQDSRIHQLRVHCLDRNLPSKLVVGSLG